MEVGDRARRFDEKAKNALKKLIKRNAGSTSRSGKLKEVIITTDVGLQK